MIRSFVVLLNSFVFIPCTLQQQKLDGPIEIPDLGRHFRLGNLYNIRTDQIVPGRSLWTEERLRMHETRPIPFTEFQIAASDDFNSKASLFDLEVGIRASFLSGQIKVEGAAKYLDDRASSNYVTRMSLKYTAMTHMKELVMEHLGPGNFDFPYVFDNEEVTHVVTRVEYGAQAVLIFESDSHNSSHKREIRGRLKIGVAVMPALSIAGEGSLNLTDEEKNEFSRFRCTFYGDVNPPIAPTNYLDAIHMYKLLPKQINQQTSVPVKVYLFPLSKLDSKGARLLRQISANLLKRVETTFEEYHEVEKVLGDIINYSPTFRELPTMKTHVELFKNSLETQKLQFQRRVARILPEIRGQGKAERDLAQILIDHESSPYSLERATNWIDWKIREAKSLEPLLSWKPPLVATQPGELEGVLFHRVNKDTMVLMLQLYPSTDHFSNCMLRQEQPECAGGSDYHSWLILPALGRGVRRKMYFLQELYERNNISVTKSRPRPSFAIGHFSSRDAMDKNVTFRWYKGSEIAHGDFRPPEMRDLTVTVRGRFAVLNWRIEGSESLIEGYKILFRRKPDGEWNVALSDDKNPSYNLQMPAESQKIALLEKGNAFEIQIVPICTFGFGIGATIDVKPNSCWSQWYFHDSPVLADGPAAVAVNASHVTLAAAGWHGPSRDLSGPPEIYMSQWSTRRNGSWEGTGIKTKITPALSSCDRCKMKAGIFYKHLTTGHVWYGELGTQRFLRRKKRSAKTYACCRSWTPPAVTFDRSTKLYHLFLTDHDGTLIHRALPESDVRNGNFLTSSSAGTVENLLGKIQPGLADFERDVNKVEGIPSSAPSATMRGGSSLHVAIRGILSDENENRLLLRQKFLRQHPKAWSPNWDTPIKEKILHAPAIISWGTGRLDVFYVGIDQVLRHYWWEELTEKWEGPENLGGMSTSAPVAVSRHEDSLDVFVRGENMKIMRRSYGDEYCHQ